MLMDAVVRSCRHGRGLGRWLLGDPGLSYHLDCRLYRGLGGGLLLYLDLLKYEVLACLYLLTICVKDILCRH